MVWHAANLITLSTPIGGVAVTGEKQWDMEFFVRIFDSKHNVHPRVKRLNIDPGKILVSCELQPVKPLFHMHRAWLPVRDPPVFVGHSRA